MGSGEDNEPIPKDRGLLRRQWIYNGFEKGGRSSGSED
jgi:hypothetical protein